MLVCLRSAANMLGGVRMCDSFFAVYDVTGYHFMHAAYVFVREQQASGTTVTANTVTVGPDAHQICPLLCAVAYCLADACQILQFAVCGCRSSVSDSCQVLPVSFALCSCPLSETAPSQILCFARPPAHHVVCTCRVVSLQTCAVVAV